MPEQIVEHAFYTDVGSGYDYVAYSSDKIEWPEFSYGKYISSLTQEKHSFYSFFKQKNSYFFVHHFVTGAIRRNLAQKKSHILVFKTYVDVAYLFFNQAKIIYNNQSYSLYTLGSAIDSEVEKNQDLPINLASIKILYENNMFLFLEQQRNFILEQLKSNQITQYLKTIFFAFSQSKTIILPQEPIYQQLLLFAWSFLPEQDKAKAFFTTAYIKQLEGKSIFINADLGEIMLEQFIHLEQKTATIGYIDSFINAVMNLDINLWQEFYKIINKYKLSLLKQGVEIDFIYHLLVIFKPKLQQELAFSEFKNILKIFDNQKFTDFIEEAISIEDILQGLYKSCQAFLDEKNGLSGFKYLDENLNQLQDSVYFVKKLRAFKSLPSYPNEKYMAVIYSVIFKFSMLKAKIKETSSFYESYVYTVLYFNSHNIVLQSIENHIKYLNYFDFYLSSETNQIFLNTLLQQADDHVFISGLIKILNSYQIFSLKLTLIDFFSPRIIKTAALCKQHITSINQTAFKLKIISISEKGL